jgi:hypothetical protein
MSATYVVRCPDYTHAAKTREAAEAWVERVEAAGHCSYPHTIEESPTPDATLCAAAAVTGDD